MSDWFGRLSPMRIRTGSDGFYVVFGIGSVVGREILGAQFEDNASSTIQWIEENCHGGVKVVYDSETDMSGAEMAIRFTNETDAIMFKTRFQ